MEEVAVEGDRLGFYGFLMSDHYMWQTRMPNDIFTIDSWTTLTYLAAKIEHIKLGTQFTPIPRGNPAQFAKMLSTLLASSRRFVPIMGAILITLLR